MLLAAAASVLSHAFDVQAERLPCSLDRIIESGRGGDGAGEVRERYIEPGVVLVDQGDVVLAHLTGRLSYLRGSTNNNRASIDLLT